MAWNLVSSALDANVESLIYFSSVDVYGQIANAANERSDFARSRHLVWISEIHQ